MKPNIINAAQMLAAEQRYREGKVTRAGLIAELKLLGLPTSAADKCCRECANAPR